jgi:polyisoprenoid-binding protein YceI
LTDKSPSTDNSVASSNSKEIKSNVKSNKPDPFTAKGFSIDELVGNYEIVSSSAVINFSLGPKGGRTNGQINQFTGTIKIEENTGSSSFTVNMPVKNLTTNNELRDESLREEGYFNISKFPKMTFKSKKLSPKNDYYVLDGEFTMLGESKPLQVQLKYIGTISKGDDKYPTFIGKASIDRTKHGMTPDSKEGNIVDFDFKIELKKVKKEEKSDKEAKPKKKDNRPKKRERDRENRPARNNRNSD